ncbi:YdcF family protein [Streptomyces zhihengii]|uniref:YdcF family protein n=1 Tax=Streptomyces zhihengii TaxID=1818004 RepID=A0ABS2UWZ9_9ACTN|nr:YdcF family protein [Streptomyces zhihengii]MBM9621884.1 YdcF family protein [Streptomyces zhihengii]
MSDARSSLSSDVQRDVETLWDFHVSDSGRTKADFLIVLGSHDTRVADRAAELYLEEEAAPVIVVTGGAGKVTSKEWSKPEAEIYAERLRRAGVPQAAILTEPKASNTGENFEFSRVLLEEHGVPSGSAIIVSKPYMAQRATATARKRWPAVDWRTRPPRTTVWEYPTDEVPLTRMINLMVGDLQRLRVYAEKGFQAPVEVPEAVWSAYERLAAAGFDQFVLD